MRAEWDRGQNLNKPIFFTINGTSDLKKLFEYYPEYNPAFLMR